MPNKIIIRRGRTKDYAFDLYQNGNLEDPLVLEVTDNIRCKISQRHSGTPDLDIETPVATPNKSQVTITEFGSAPSTPARAVVRVAQGDASELSVGDAVMELILVDDSEVAPADAAYSIRRFTAFVEDSMEGDIDL